MYIIAISSPSTAATAITPATVSSSSSFKRPNRFAQKKKTIWRKKPTSNKTKQNYNWRRLAKEVGSISAQHILLYPNQQYHKYLWTTIIYHHVTDWLFDCCRLYLFNQKKKFLLPLKTTIKNVYFCLLSQMNI